MSIYVPAHFVQSYGTNVQLLLQQRGSRLRSAVVPGNYVGKAAKAVEQVGPVNAVKRTSRHADSPLISTPADARWVFPTDYEWGDLIDDQDKIRMLIDPQSSYAQNGAYALGRSIDEEIIDAFFGTSKTGENGSTSIAFPAGNQIAQNFQIGGAGGTGLSLEKLRKAKQLLLAAEVDVDNDPLYLALTAKQHDDMLGLVQATNLDYTNRPTLVDGKITSFMGFNFIHTEKLGVDANAYRRLPCWAKSGMHLGLWNEITTKIAERPDKAFATYVYVKGTFGATRVEEGKVIEIKCQEA
jgi:hypothetical protein